MIRKLADSAVRRLKAQMATFVVDHFPDAPDRFPWASARESLLVGYEGSTYAEPESMLPMSADRTVDFSVTVLVRSLRGDLGAQSVLEDVRKALFGWRPTELVDDVEVPLGFRAVFPVRDGFVSENQGNWRYVIIFRTRILTVAGPETDPNLSGPPFTTPVFLTEECPEP